MMAFANKQDFLWISDNNQDDQTITELWYIDDRPMHIYRTEEDDRIAFEELPKEDENEVKHQWW